MFNISFIQRNIQVATFKVKNKLHKNIHYISKKYIRGYYNGDSIF